jgi:hypothetical protein
MYFPRELFIDFYQHVRVFDDPFASWRWKPLGPRSTSSQRESWHTYVFEMNQTLGVTSLDLGLSPDTIRGFFVEASRAYHHHLLRNGVANPLMVEPDRVTEAFFGFGIARDTAAARSFGELYARATAGLSEADLELAASPFTGL